jgi:glycosyltransferase involved in cell wall biosynthesis
MNLLLECFACDPSHGSESFNAWRWSQGLAKAGHRVTLLTTEVGREATRREIQLQGLKNIDLHVIPRNRQLLKLKFGFYLDYAQWLNRAAKYAAKLELPDVAHHISWANVAFGTRLWRLGRPTLLGPCGGGQVMHPNLFPYLEADRAFERIRSALVAGANRYSVLPGAGLEHCHVLASNEETLQMAKTRGAKSAEFFADTMVDESDLPETYQERPRGAKLRVLWVGRMLPRKGIELALKAFALASLDAELIVLGDGPRMARAKELAKTLSISESVTFMGSVPRSDVAGLLRSGDIFLFASLRDSMGNQLLEAMAAGLPIVCLDAYGAKLLVSDSCGIKVSIDDGGHIEQLLAQALQRLAASEELRTRLGRSAFESSQGHLWVKKIQKMTLTYERIASRP